MFKAIKIIFALLVVAVVGILGLALTKPDDFRVQRSTSIKAPPEKVFAILNDFHNWPQWSPWEHKDPAMKRSYSGPVSGKGAAYAWEGDKNVGHGSMEIVESSPPSKIMLKLDFLKPFEAHNLVDFTIVRSGDSTNVDWAMYGPSPFISKVMTVFMSMDKMVGKDFETGLANLKAAAEK
jgi:uncharacterized protein YndB with AHSA1/START domain